MANSLIRWVYEIEVIGMSTSDQSFLWLHLLHFNQVAAKYFEGRGFNIDYWNVQIALPLKIQALEMEYKSMKRLN